MRTLLILSFLLVSAATAGPLRPGDLFPDMEGRALDNKTERLLPAAAEGKPFFAVFIFSRGARDGLKDWATALLEREETKSFAVFQIPMLQRAPSFMRWMIRRDIRNDAPASVHHTFLLMTEGDEQWRERLRVRDDAYVHIAAVSADGRFLGSHTGPFSVQAFKTFVGSLNMD